MPESDPETDPTHESDPVGQVRKSEEEQKAETLQWHRLAGLGVEFIAAVGLFGLAGYWLDRKFGTKPWLLIAGIGIGFAAGLYQMVRAANRMFR